MTAVRLAVTLLLAIVFLAVRSSNPTFKKSSRFFSLSEPQSSLPGILNAWEGISGQEVWSWLKLAALLLELEGNRKRNPNENVEGGISSLDL